MGKLFDAPLKNAMDGDTKYSRAIRTPQYVPSEIAPNIQGLMNTEKYGKLVYNIKNDKNTYISFSLDCPIIFLITNLNTNRFTITNYKRLSSITSFYSNNIFSRFA